MNNTIPLARLGRYAAAAADEGRVCDLQRVARDAAADAVLLAAAGEDRLASGALTVMLRTLLLRAATPSGAEGRSVEADTAIKRRCAEALERAGAPLAATMVRAALGEPAVATSGPTARPSSEGAS